MTQTGNMVAAPLPEPNAFATSHANLETAAENLRALVKRHGEEATVLTVQLRDERVELKRTERLLAAVERIENPRPRKAAKP